MASTPPCPSLGGEQFKPTGASRIQEDRCLPAPDGLAVPVPRQARQSRRVRCPSVILVARRSSQPGTPPNTRVVGVGWIAVTPGCALWYSTCQTLYETLTSRKERRAATGASEERAVAAFRDRAVAWHTSNKGVAALSRNHCRCMPPLAQLHPTPAAVWIGLKHQPASNPGVRSKRSPRRHARRHTPGAIPALTSET